MTQSFRILFLGMNGIFSTIPFEGLLRAGHTPVGLVIPAIDSASPLLPFIAPPPQKPDPNILLAPAQPPLTALAAANNIPIFTAGSLRRAGSLTPLYSLKPDLIVVACFPRLLPQSWLDIPQLGGLNLHPSMLPAYRGPAPLFWQFRARETNTGITLHWMDAAADTGPIATQTHVPFPDGITTREADRLTAAAGARLLIEALSNPEDIPRWPQTGTPSYQSHPTESDRILSTDWTARRAFNFVRGAQDWGPFLVEGSGAKPRPERSEVEGYLVNEAVTFQEGMVLGADITEDGDSLWVQFAGGVVEFRH